jgi:ankyrin repeat protein
MNMSDRNDRIDLCLQKGADINARDKDGLTPLMLAVIKRRTGLVKFLLTKNPDLFATDKYGRTAFDFLPAAGQDADTRKALSGLLLGALPDAGARKGAAPVQEKDAAGAFNDIATQEGIRVGKPITVAGKNDSKKTGGGNGGFKL